MRLDLWTRIRRGPQGFSAFNAMPKRMRTINLAIILKNVRRLKVDLDQHITSEQDNFPFGEKWHSPGTKLAAENHPKAPSSEGLRSWRPLRGATGRGAYAYV
jgi:hypothetical protein